MRSVKSASNPMRKHTDDLFAKEEHYRFFFSALTNIFPKIPVLKKLKGKKNLSKSSYFLHVEQNHVSGMLALFKKKLSYLKKMFV